MQFYASEAAEALAVRRAAKAAGCRVCSLTRSPSSVVLVGGVSRLEPSGGPLQTLGKLVCPDGWVAARLLLALAGEDSRTSGARSLALRMRASSSDRPRVERARGVLHSGETLLAFVVVHEITLLRAGSAQVMRSSH